MFKIKNNTYREEQEYMICECGDKYFKFDKDDYERIKQHHWSISKKNRVYTHINKKEISLSRFLTYTNDPNIKVLLKNRDVTDYRKQNLYVGNTYIEKDDYYIGICFNDEEFLIDKDDYEWVKKYKWHVDKNGYVLTKINGKSYKQHRMILNLTSNDLEEVDHINHNQLDNRKKNLRLVSRSQQNMNERISKINTSGKKGVYKMSGYDKWCAQINANGKRYYLGSYNNYEDAVNARLEAACKLHQEYQCE